MTQEARDDTKVRRQRKKPVSKKGVVAILRLVLGAGVTPAEGSVKPTAGFTFNDVILPSLRRL
jgi:hypothetical protein